MRMPHRQTRRVEAFVLLEVLLSLTILGIATAAFMHSFTQSLKAARLMEIQTQATFLAEQIMEELEVYPPHPAGPDRIEAGFGEAYPEYYYLLERRYEEPRYRELRNVDDQVERFFALRHIHLEIHYDDGKEKMVPLTINTAIVGFEKFSLQTRQSYAAQESPL